MLGDLLLHGGAHLVAVPVGLHPSVRITVILLLPVPLPLTLWVLTHGVDIVMRAVCLPTAYITDLHSSIDIITKCARNWVKSLYIRLESDACTFMVHGSWCLEVLLWSQDGRPWCQEGLPWYQEGIP